MNEQTRSILERIAGSYSREKDLAQPNWLVHEIQFQLGCTYGRALTYASNIRIADDRNLRACEQAALKGALELLA
jgi:hypothetical protein